MLGRMPSFSLIGMTDYITGDYIVDDFPCMLRASVYDYYLL